MLVVIMLWYHCCSSLIWCRMEICDVPQSPVWHAIVEIPGIKKEDIVVNVMEDGRLIVFGERRIPPLLHNDTNTTLPRYPVREIKYGRYERVIEVPSGLQVCYVVCLCYSGRSW